MWAKYNIILKFCFISPASEFVAGNFLITLCRCILQLIRTEAVRPHHDGVGGQAGSRGDSAFVSGDLLESFEEQQTGDSGLQLATEQEEQENNEDAVSFYEFFTHLHLLH